MSVPATYGPRVIVPVVADFLLVHPGVEIDIRLDDGRLNMTTSRLDLAVVAGGPPHANLVRHRLAYLRPVIVAAPSLLAQHGSLGHPTDLKRLPCLIDAREDSSWRFKRGAQTCEVQPRRVLAAQDVDTLLLAAERGVGVAKLPDYLVEDGIRAGDLLPALRDWTGTPVEVCLVTSDAALRPERVAAFAEHIRARIGSPEDAARTFAENASGRSVTST